MTMLLITSNWAITDGSLSPSGAGRAAGWLEAIRRSVGRAGRGRDGRYQPVPEATLVFAGDTFDWLLSAAWAGRDRPWHGGHRPAEVRGRVASAAMRLAAPVLRRLCRWARRGIEVPAADGRGRPSASAAATVLLRPVLLAGDRDWWLAELAAAAGRLGMLVGDEWSDGLRQVRHGHDLDPLAHARGSFSDRRERPPTLAESLAVDLVVPFAVAAREEAALWPEVRSVLRQLCVDRPSAMPSRLGAVMQSLAERPAARAGRDRLAALWRRRVADWHAVARRDVPACETEFDAVDDLSAWLERLDPTLAPPVAVRRLDMPAAMPANHGVVVGHPHTTGGPILSCHRGLGHVWQERLAAVAGPAVVVIGSGDAGKGFIDAA